MTDNEKFKRDIEGLVESVRLCKLEFSRLNLTNEERESLHEHLDWLVRELHDLRAKAKLASHSDTSGSAD
jgi:hypothetical protein